MPSPIVTSIPPVFSRKDAEGREIGEAYLARCVQSWRDCGFDPVTVNSVNEALHPLIATLGIRVERVPRDAAAITGRPHVFLQDLLDAARRVCGERVFITNADIELEMTSDASARVARLGPMQALALRRRDHNGEKNLDTVPYDSGVDLLGVGRSALEGIDAGALVFGMPWWDHFVPLMLLWRGAEVAPGSGALAWHLDHDGRWNKKQYIRSGQEFLRLIDAVPADMRRDPWVSDHVARLRRIRRGAYGTNLARQVEARLVAHLMPRARIHIRRVLRETSLANTAVLDRITGGA